ncbi:MAG: VOC family protein [Pseudomonadota bacterium]
MIEALRSVRYTVGDLAQARHWYSQWLDVLPYPATDGVLRYGLDGSWLELVEEHGDHTQAHGSVLAYWGVDSLGQELERLQALGINPQTPPALLDASNPPTATFVDPFGNVVGLVEVHDPHAQRARAHRAAEKIALRNVRAALDDLGEEERQQRLANRLVLALVVVGLLVGGFAMVKMLPHKPQEDKLSIPLQGKK